MTRNRLGIVPHLNFHCNARITRIRVRLLPDENIHDYPYIQIWRPSSHYSITYTKIAQVKVTESQITRSTYVEANIPLFGTNRIVVETGDVIGYYHPVDVGYRVRTIQTAGYILYEFKDIDGSIETLVDLDDSMRYLDVRQPLMEFTVGKLNRLLLLEYARIWTLCTIYTHLYLSCLDMQCVTLVLYDGLEISCDSTYTTGVGYEGDTCSFTCKAGYEFTGSDTRTCLSNSKWSGSEAICRKGE